jgi:hypothetical protein
MRDATSEDPTTQAPSTSDPVPEAVELMMLATLCLGAVLVTGLAL